VRDVGTPITRPARMSPALSGTARRCR
jgi:hypothetical protein